MSKKSFFKHAALMGLALFALMKLDVYAEHSVGQAMELKKDTFYEIWDAYDEQENLLKPADRMLYDDGGEKTGWLKYDGNYTNGYSRKYSWCFEKAGTEQYYMRNQGTGFAVLGSGITGQEGYENMEFVVSDKTKQNTGSPYTLEIKAIEGDTCYVVIRSVETNKYLSTENGTGKRTYAIFKEGDGNNKADAWWGIRKAELMAPQEGKQALWETSFGKVHYRIPAITTANNGNIVAVADYRYDTAYDLGTNWPGYNNLGHQIDLVKRTSLTNGRTWSISRNLTDGLTRPGTQGKELALSYGDAALVGDRESDKVLLVSVSGSYGYMDVDRTQASYMLSEDNGETFGEPVRIDEQIYKLNPDWKAFFFASGRIMQSRYIKVGEYYRIYSAILAREGNTATNANHVLYSDDFGKTWNVLGEVKASPVPAGDEAKIEELPNGDVLISSRKGSGRYINVFHYNKEDSERKTGLWDSRQELNFPAGNSTNGEVYITYVRNTDTGEYGYLALQSLPTLKNDRRVGVSVYYKELEKENITAKDYISGWNNNDFYLLQQYNSAYSTCTLQPDGKLGFLWEERDSNYDIVYRAVSISEITGGKYEIAFQGIGSKTMPYVVTTREQAEAVKNVYGAEQVNWKYIGQAASIGQ
ncbi:MAG: sialidase family protein [Lachnospiraceae bacterium]